MEGTSVSTHGHRHHMQSRARDSVSLVFSFFLSIALTSIMVLTVLRVGIFTKYGFRSFYDGKYYEYVLNYIEDQTSYYTLPTGIDPKVLDGVFVEGEIEENISNYINSLFEKYAFEPDVSAARDRLEASVRRAFNSDGIDVTEESEAEQVASAYVDEIMVFYASMLKPTGLDSAETLRSLFCKYFPYVMISLAVLAIALLILLKRLHHFQHRTIRYVAYSMGGAALLGFVVPAIVYVSGFYKGLNIAPQYFYHFGVTVIEHVLTLCMMGSAVLGVIMVVLVFVVARMRKAVLRKGHLHHGKGTHIHEG